MYKEPPCVEVKTLIPKDANGKEPPQQDRVYETDGLMTALSAQLSGRYNIIEPLIIDDQGRRNKEHQLHDICPTLRGQMHGNQPKVYDPYNQTYPIDQRNATTLRTNHTNGNAWIEKQSRIRRLTPRECMRLQGVPDCITDKLIAAGISDTQLYRAAGDACTVNVVYEIACAMS
jgi:DNA (cytosine-5)-methyltransferase 1